MQNWGKLITVGPNVLTIFQFCDLVHHLNVQLVHSGLTVFPNLFLYTTTVLSVIMSRTNCKPPPALTSLAININMWFTAQ